MGKGCACITFLGFAALGAATPSCLISIPIADILGHREAFYSVSATGHARSVSKGYEWSHCLTIGIYDQLEVGFDNDTLGKTTLNVKGLLYQNVKSGFALSAGFQNVALTGGNLDRYVVARKDFPKFRLHAGWLSNDRSRLLLGFDCPMGKGWSFMAENTSGPDGVSWAALNIPTPVKGLGLMVAGGVPNDRKVGIQHQVAVTYAFKF